MQLYHSKYKNEMTKSLLVFRSALMKKKNVFCIYGRPKEGSNWPGRIFTWHFLAYVRQLHIN